MTNDGRPWWSRTVATIGIQQMAHRPPLPRRWAVYCVLAYILPIVALEALPESMGTIREVSWLVTLAPAFILSLHYGMLGALAGLIVGTLLYVTVQLVLDFNFVDVNQSVLLPIYVSYGMLAIAVGWLSQQLHDFYNRLVKAERLAAIGEVAVTLRHELNNALQAITAEAGVLQVGTGLGPHEREGVATILDMARRIQGDVAKLASLTDAPATSYLGDVKMVDLAAAIPAPVESPAAGGGAG
jgi:glucose-6-phosphate-specific signal transduction histidine kinase